MSILHIAHHCICCRWEAHLLYKHWNQTKFTHLFMNRMGSSDSCYDTTCIILALAKHPNIGCIDPAVLQCLVPPPPKISLNLYLTKHIGTGILLANYCMSDYLLAVCYLTPTDAMSSFSLNNHVERLWKSRWSCLRRVKSLACIKAVCPTHYYKLEG